MISVTGVVVASIAGLAFGGPILLRSFRKPHIKTAVTVDALAARIAAEDSELGEEDVNCILREALERRPK